MTNNVVRTVLTTTPVACCGLGALPHVGSYRLIGRVYAAPTASSVASDFKVRLSWLEGSGPLRSNPWVSPVAVNGFSEIDLGIVSVPPKTLGTQRWTGQLEAFSAAAGDTLDIDYILLFPTDAYGKARALAPKPQQVISSFSARDEFDQTAGNLNGKTLPVGGTWATSGADATDIAVETSGHTAQRATISDGSGKLAIPGTATFTDVLVQIDAKASATDGTGVFQVLYARYVDASNYVILTLQPSSTGNHQLVLQVVVAGVAVFAKTVTVAWTTATWYSLRLQALASGSVFAAFFPRGGTPQAWDIEGSHSSLATGGALASGKVAFRDQHAGSAAVTRNYDNFAAAVPAVDAVIYSGRSCEINSQTTERYDSTGTYSGPIQTYRGAHFMLQPAGDESRINEVLVEARRNDTDTMADDQIADSTTVAVHYTPKYLVVPR